MPRQICRQFARNGTCSWGDRCRFSHEPIQSSNSTHQTRSRRLSRFQRDPKPKPKPTDPPPVLDHNPYEDEDSSDDDDGPAPVVVQFGDWRDRTDYEDLFKCWRMDVGWCQAPDVSTEVIEKIFKECKRLLDSKRPSIQQETISELAGVFPRMGLALVETVADLPAPELQKVLLLVLQVLTYPEVVQSLVCEEHVVMIYQAFCGDDGQRGLSFFQNALQVLSVPNHAPDEDQQAREAVQCALDAFVRMLKWNPGITDSLDFKEVATMLERLGAEILAAPENHMLSEAWKALGNKTQAGTLAGAFDDVAEQLAIAHLDDARFQRHDNDFAHISRIQILPTAGEIASSVPEYLPSKDPRTHHFPGAQGLLDRQFRLLREDTVGHLRDAIRQTRYRSTNDRNDQSQSIRFSAFRNASITDSFVDKMMGLVQIVEFDQPRSLQNLSSTARRAEWSVCRDLSKGSIVCVTGDDHTVFFTVADRDPQDDDNSRRRPMAKPVEGNKPTDLFNDAKRAAIVLRPVTCIESTLTQIFKLQNTSPKATSTLVEFPGLLLASFEHTLGAFQQMSRSADLPFANLLAPSVFDTQSNATARPPRYTTREGFEFDLTKIANGTKIAFKTQEDFDLTDFARASKLDESQSNAFIYALRNEFALIQGPPGTGKSFIGVKLIQALLHNKATANIGPIICVCYTNHALDQILEHLLNSGIRQVIRIGGGSKSKRLESNNLWHVTNDFQTDNEAYRIRLASLKILEITKAAKPVLQKMTKDKSTDIKQVLQFCDDFQHQEGRLNVMKEEVSHRCLLQANVVGITATGLARQVGLLRRLNSKVLLIEEAGEILEAHTLPTMLPSLEHVIAIGDHQQLRPQISNNDLSVENPNGKEYSLDVSLFERLIHPEAGLPSQPFATLQTQRRMHPSISRLIRSTIYPILRDGGSVAEYPEVRTMPNRLYWFHHENPECADGLSKGNDFEVEMAVALVTHLVEHGKHKAKSITVLTPYLAQMRKLQRGFSKRFEIELGDKDKGELRNAGLLEKQDRARASLGAGLRISTVDNYQGEEADIVVVSLVRSNRAGNVGFLRTPNRINVLLSRARQGLYLIGNAIVARNVDMWKEVTNILENDGAIGTTIPVVCPKHKVSVSVSGPRDFSRLVDKNGCNAACRR